MTYVIIQITTQRSRKNISVKVRVVGEVNWIFSVVGKVMR